MNAKEIIKEAQDDFTRLSKLPINGVIGLAKNEEGWVGWFNNRRLLERIGNIPPAEFEEAYYNKNQETLTMAVRLK